ncbi:MAG: SDR family oxidoreductase [Pseudomonadota bacterium]
MKCLVTGGAGFIGSHIVEALLMRGDEVVILDDLSSGKMENLGDDVARVRFIEGDVADPKAAAEAVRDVDFVFHQAAIGSVPRSVEHPMASHHANATGTLQMLIAARDAKVKSFVNAASSSAYGDTPELPKRENMPPNPFSPYAATKMGQESYCRSFAVSYGMRTVSLRYFNVYGPRQDPESQYAAVVPKFFDAFLRGRAPVIYGDGEQTRDFTFVTDVVSANLKASVLENAAGEVFNIAGGKKITINELAAVIQKLTGAKTGSKHEPARAGDIRHSLADVGLAAKQLGWKPTTTLADGLRFCFEWYRDQVPAA